MLAGEYEPGHPHLFHGDPRTEPGEPLWPARFGTAEIATLKRSMSAFDVAGQLQQRPSPGGGGVFETSWWNWFDPDEQRRRYDDVVTSWDLAFTGRPASDYCVGQAWASDGNDRFLLRSIRERFSFPEMLDAVKDLSEWVTQTHRIEYPTTYIEQAANGEALVATLRSSIPNLQLLKPMGSKRARAHAVLPMIASGRVYLPGALNQSGRGIDPAMTPAWVADFLDETESSRSALTTTRSTR